MATTILGILSPLIIAAIKAFLNRKKMNAESRKKYLAYIEYWEKKRITPVMHGDDISDHLKDENEKD